ncbi:hypothetical protein GCM10027605_51530 [Micromonospora zhanjiangensis]
MQSKNFGSIQPPWRKFNTQVPDSPVEETEAGGVWQDHFQLATVGDEGDCQVFVMRTKAAN